MNAAPPEQPAQITPELLVDALSGHEDGLLAIAERLMLSYDSGYDAMGEAIIDAFADVQRLFQHVVEAAHMEGAAFESSRSRNEWRERAERVERERGVRILDDLGLGDGGEEEADNTNNSEGLSQGNPPHRHEELIDQDVRDVLLSAIKKSEGLLKANKHEECRALYERTCHSASALLPVDSDHRGRLQLATARAESMSPDRSCAILRYAMDDVLRSGLSLREGRYKDERERRGDCVLRRVDPLMGGKDGDDRELNRKGSRSFEASESGSIGHNSLSNPLDVTTTTVEQSADEALASLVEEMKEILQAPVYATTPLLSVSDKFWMALTEAKKSQNRKMERLEQMLAKIKADFLLAREEWEDQLSQEREKTEAIKRKFNNLKLQSDISVQRKLSEFTQTDRTIDTVSTPNRSQVASSHQGGSTSPYQFTGFDSNLDTKQNNRKNASSSSSVVSMGSEFAQRAKSLVHLMNCQSGDRERELSPRASGESQQRYSTSGR
ncbi:hypothetical protein ACHAWO_007418 [Cyclotella atomus]|uniref:Uncharacterized protein n=1 Tax=Cyclotella atomus TaxID=382360 RepID=A0ABD3QGT0_9STRA